MEMSSNPARKGARVLHGPGGESSLRFHDPFTIKPALLRSQSVYDHRNRPQRPAFSRQNSILKMAPEIPPGKKRQLAIKVQNVCLTYGEGGKTNYVLNGLSLNVPKGEF